jgi:hypothetical protein
MGNHPRFAFLNRTNSRDPLSLPAKISFYRPRRSFAAHSTR